MSNQKKWTSNRCICGNNYIVENYPEGHCEVGNAYNQAVLERDEARAAISRSGSEWAKMFDQERQSKLQYQEDLKASQDKTLALQEQIASDHELESKSMRRRVIREGKLVKTLANLKEYAANIQKNHPDECSHGAGYSLLGELALQVTTDTHYALLEFKDSFKK